MRVPIVWAIACLLATHVHAQGQAEQDLCLKERVDVAGSDIAVRDLLASGAERLDAPVAGHVLGHAPRAANVVRISRVELARALRVRAPALRVRWCGAEWVTVRMALERVAGSALAAVAVDALERRLRLDYPTASVRTDGLPADADVPVGAHVLKARFGTDARPRARMLVWVDVMAGNDVVRSVPVLLAVSAPGSGWFALRDVAAGTTLGADDVAVRDADLLAEGGTLDATVAVPGHRTAVPLRAGRAVRARDLAARDDVMAGDAVTIVAGNGTVRVETTGVAVGRAGQGARVAVRTAHGDAIAARVSGKGMVVIE